VRNGKLGGRRRRENARNKWAKKNLDCEQWTMGKGGREN